MYGVFKLFAGMILYEKGIYTPAKKFIEKIIKKVYDKNIFKSRKSL